MPVNGLLFQNKLVTHASPTLMKMKTGSLFCVNKIDIPNIEDCIHYFNKHLSSHHIQICLLKDCQSRHMIYLYHEEKLVHTLKQSEIQAFLNEYGYDTSSIHAAMNCLRIRLQSDAFPHEIGVFLGYPLYDVKQFICQDHPHKCIGNWKVFGNEKNARKKFQRIKYCSNEMMRKIEQGHTIIDIVNNYQ